MKVYIDTSSSRGRGWVFYLQDVSGGVGANGTFLKTYLGLGWVQNFEFRPFKNKSIEPRQN